MDEKDWIRQRASAKKQLHPEGHKGTEAEACFQSGRAGGAAQVLM